MLEGIVLLAFIAALAGCVFTGASVLWALAGGYLIFCAYGLIRKHSLAELGKMSLSGVKTVRNILMIFGLIGFITALWRAPIRRSASSRARSTSPSLPVAGIRHDCGDRVLVVEAGVAVGISGDRVPS